MKMVNYYIYAKDYSGSTEDEDYYHTNGLKTLEQFKSDVEKLKTELANSEDPPPESKVIFLHWGHVCEEVDEETIRTAYIEKIGEGLKSFPQGMIEWLKVNYDICSENSTIRLLYIITDGKTEENSVDKCFRSNTDMYYDRVVFHAFNEDLNEINLSVASSFFKSHCVVYCNNELYDNTIISLKFDYDNISIDNFAVEKNNLKSYIKLKFLQKFNTDVRALKEIKYLKKLRVRLFNDLSIKMQGECNINLETKDRKKFINEFERTGWYKNLASAPDLMMKTEIEKTIASLINYLVSENKSYTFDELILDSKFSKSIKEEPLVDVNFTAEQEIAFPDVILGDDKGIPVVILFYVELLEKIIFNDKMGIQVQLADFSKFKTITECPLFLLNDKDISESIGYFYTLNVYKQLLANGTKIDRQRGKPFEGGVVLSDTDQFDRYNDYILSVTYFNSKKISFNVGLFYYVLWKNCENKDWMDGNVIKHFKKYAMRRISETVCKIGLLSLPLDPQLNTSLLMALWYCVDLSSYFFKDDAKNFTHERMRKFYSVTHCMIEILKYFDYDIDIETIERRREAICHVMVLKKIKKQSEKVYYLLKNIFKTVDGFLVSEIEKPFNLYKLNYLKFNHKKILNDDLIKETVNLKDYVHFMHIVGDVESSKSGEGTIEISEKTFRPFFAIDESKSFYTELLKITKQVIITNNDERNEIKISLEPIDSLEFDRVLSLYNLFINCVIDLEKYPTLPEYVEYIHKKKRYFGNLVTIFPSNVYFDILYVFAQYQKVVSNIEVKEFIKVCHSYDNRIERIKAEQKVKFNTDYTKKFISLKQFVSNEEMKVNLKKETWYG